MNWTAIGSIATVLTLLVIVWPNSTGIIVARLRWSLNPYTGVVFAAASIAVGAWLLRLATLGESIGFGVGAAFGIVTIWLRKRSDPEGGTWHDELAYLFGEVGIGLTIAIISFIVFDPVIFDDDFSDKSGGWPEGESGGGAFKYADVGYLLSASPDYGGTQARADNA